MFRIIKKDIEDNIRLLGIAGVSNRTAFVDMESSCATKNYDNLQVAIDKVNEFTAYDGKYADGTSIFTIQERYILGYYTVYAACDSMVHMIDNMMDI